MKKWVYFFIFLAFFYFLFPPVLTAQGKVEFGFHYSKWSLNILKGVIEDGLAEGVDSTFRNEFLDAIQADYPGLTETSYSQSVTFDSNGNNFGFEIRWYPGGYDGSFSMGLAIEKTSMTISIPEMTAQMELSDGSTFESDSHSEFLIDPLSFHLSFRWDIMPTSVVHPYITLGFGAATGTSLENAEFNFYYKGELFVMGQTKIYEAEETKTLKEIRDEMEGEEDEFFLPGFIPFIQASIGLKGKITDQLHLLVDAGIWNGFLIRGGVAFRF